MALAVLFLLVVSGPLLAGGPGGRVEYIGGTLAVRDKCGGSISSADDRA